MNILDTLKQLRDDIKTWVGNNLNDLNTRLTRSINNIPKFSGDYNDLNNAPQITEDESGSMVIADENSNVIFKADADGIHTTSVSISESIVSESKDWKVVDDDGNIIFTIDAEGVHTTSLTLNGMTIQEMIEACIDETILKIFGNAGTIDAGRVIEN
jgi:hypothetical protein